MGAVCWFLAAGGALVTLAATDAVAESRLPTWWFGIAWGLLAIGLTAFVLSFFGTAKLTHEDELLQRIVALLERSTDQRLSTEQLAHDSGASQREVRQAVAALEGQGRVRLQGQEVTIRVEPAAGHDQVDRIWIRQQLGNVTDVVPGQTYRVEVLYSLTGKPRGGTCHVSVGDVFERSRT
jgi:hypothetical protein